MGLSFVKANKFAFLVLCVFLSSCLDHQFDDNKEEEVPPEVESSNGIPGDFDYATTTLRTLTVEVKDEYAGKYFYTVEAYTTNPILDASAKLLAGAKTNQHTPFKMEIVIPKIQKMIYVRLTDPKGYKYISELEVGEGDLLLDYNASVPEAKTQSSLRSDIDKGEVNYEATFEAGMQQATEVTKDVAIEVNGIYKITDKDFKDKVVFPKGQFTLYIDEGCKLRLKDSDIELADGTKIYVLKGATIESNAADFNMSKDAILYNAGTLDLNSINLEGAELYNHPGGKVNLSTLAFNGGRFYNHCLCKVSEISFDGAGSSLYLRQHSSMDASGITFQEGEGGANIYMEAKAYMHVNKFHKQSSGWINIFGDASLLAASDCPLLQIEGEWKASNIQIQQSIFVDAKKRTGDNIIFSSPAQQIEGAIPSYLKGDCYTTENIPEEKEPTEDSKNDVYEPQTGETMAYVYMFEDSWPAVGDYDMNDVVVNVGVMNRMAGNNATTAVITGEVIAVGATKELYIFAQIDGTDKVFNLLGGQEVHSFMGKASNEVVNTYKNDSDIKPFELEVDVRGMEGLVNARNLNVFIVWGDPNSNKRNEVHVVGFQATKQADKSDKCTKDYKYISDDEYNNLMWGLMIPKISYSSFPKENSSIMSAYSEFSNWAKSGGKDVMDWYTSGNEDQLIRVF